MSSFEASCQRWSNLASDIAVEAGQPSQLTGRLHGYQLAGLGWLLGLHLRGLNGILADEMGLGKTVQVISLVASLVERAGDGGNLHPFLIIVPASVVSSWQRELATWAPHLLVATYRGNKDARERVFRTQIRRGSVHAVVTTYESCLGEEDAARLQSMTWSHLVVDEGHRLKNANCKLAKGLKQISSQARLILTGTPLQNNLQELWALLNFVLPSVFDDASDFQAWFGGEQMRAYGEDSALSVEEMALVSSRLHQVLRPFMLRRTKDVLE